MDAPAGAKFEVIILIDHKQWEDLKNKGYEDDDIEDMIISSVTLRESALCQPVMDIASVSMVKYL